jgi:FimV-like protein
MLALVIKCYFVTFLFIGLGAALIFVLGLIWIIHRARSSFAPLSEDMRAIAGDDVLATQLDLARAYMETDHKDLAKDILEMIRVQGTSHQRNEAQRLLAQI